MKSIYFYPNTYALRKTSSNELEKLLEYLLNNEIYPFDLDRY